MESIGDKRFTFLRLLNSAKCTLFKLNFYFDNYVISGLVVQMIFDPLYVFDRALVA